MEAIPSWEHNQGMRVMRIVCRLGLAGAAAMAQREEVGKGVNFYSIEKEFALGETTRRL